MKKIRAAVVGYGNIGHYTVQALEAASDFEIAGIVRRNGAENKPAELAPYSVVKDISELKDVDVAILATPTRSCEEYAKKILAMGINTVDSFDIHTSILNYRNTLMLYAIGFDRGLYRFDRNGYVIISPKAQLTLVPPKTTLASEVAHEEQPAAGDEASDEQAAHDAALEEVKIEAEQPKAEIEIKTEAAAAPQASTAAPAAAAAATEGSAK